MECKYEKTRDLYLDRELSDKKKAEFEQHMKECADCGKFIRDYKKIAPVVREAMSREIPCRISTDEIMKKILEK